MKGIKRNSVLLMTVVFAVSLFVSSPTVADEALVLGANNPEVDVQAVQTAVDKGGKILLQGMFNFGSQGKVIIRNDIEISGELDSKGNTIRNVSRNAIESLDNYCNETGQGSVLIAGNNIVTPSVGIPFPSPATPNGIVTGWFLDQTGGADPARRSKITVIKNYVQTNGDTSGGIISLADGTAVLSNRVEVMTGIQSMGILQIGSHAFIARNKINGSGSMALSAFNWGGVQSNGNTFAWNDVSEFEAASADFLCLGNQNVMIGPSCRTIDQGRGNMMLTGY